MPLFKQGISQHARFYTVVLAVLPVVVDLVFTSIVLICSGFDWQLAVECLIVFGIISIPIAIVSIPAALSMPEWFYIYEDRIEARCIWGCKNKVMIHDVAAVEEVMLHINSYAQCPYYVFYDGRKMHKDGFEGRSTFLNYKKYMLRIHKTPEVEDYILNTLHLEIQKTL